MPPVQLPVIYNKLFFIQPVKNRQEAYEKVQMSKNSDGLTGNLLNYSYNKNYDKVISIDLLRQTSPSTPQQINFAGKIEDNGANVFYNWKAAKNYC